MTPKLAEAAAGDATSAGASETTESSRGRVATARYYISRLILLCVLGVVLWFVLSAIAPGVAAVTEGLSAILIGVAMILAPIWMVLFLVKAIRQHS